jgi:AraC-like DNA-binding protein/mannose-6-phosphate isomerase-like protein (cupin superfamily)
MAMQPRAHIPWIFPDPQFSFMRVSAPRYAFPRHTHDFTELVIILRGEGQHLLDDEAYPIESGDVFVVTPDTTHAYQEVRDLEVVNLLFRPDYLRRHEAELHQLPGYHALFMLEPTYRKQHQFRSHLRLDRAAFAEVVQLVNRLEVEYEERPPGAAAMMYTLTLQLLILLARRYSVADTPASRVLVQLGAVISYIEQAYAEPITLAALADIAHMSVRTLERRFTAGLGVPPIDYLIRRRVHHGAALLHDSQASIATIAQQVGFTDSNYFTRQFTRIMGMTPRAYRRQEEG